MFSFSETICSLFSLKTSNSLGTVPSLEILKVTWPAGEGLGGNLAALVGDFDVDGVGAGCVSAATATLVVCSAAAQDRQGDYRQRHQRGTYSTCNHLFFLVGWVLGWEGRGSCCGRQASFPDAVDHKSFRLRLPQPALFSTLGALPNLACATRAKKYKVGQK